jgi:hypothetical protein
MCVCARLKFNIKLTAILNNKEEYNLTLGDWLILGRGRSKYLTYPFRIDKHIILQRNMNSDSFELGFPESCQCMCKIVDCVVFARLMTINRSEIWYVFRSKQNVSILDMQQIYYLFKRCPGKNCQKEKRDFECMQSIWHCKSGSWLTEDFSLNGTTELCHYWWHASGCCCCCCWDETHYNIKNLGRPRTLIFLSIRIKIVHAITTRWLFYRRQKIFLLKIPFFFFPNLFVLNNYDCLLLNRWCHFLQVYLSTVPYSFPAVVSYNFTPIGNFLRRSITV